MNRIQNIQKMEQILDKMNQILDELENTRRKWKKSRSDFEDLMDYYHSDEWQEDVEASNQGKYEHIKCGVLSEDAIYDLYSRQRELAFKITRTALDILEK